jgi:diaminopimelate epimerase
MIIDQREAPFQGDIPSLCHRQKGIGADGIIIMETSLIADLKMRIFNRDGQEAEMCGNGLRCFLHFAKRLGLTVSLVETLQRIHQVQGEWVELGPVIVDGPTINTGVPHQVFFEPYDEKKAEAIRFAFNTNVNFVEVLEEGKLFVKTYERGVGETLCCGTGCAAAAYAYAKKWPVEANGGLIFDWRKDSLWMKGPAVHVFDGVLSPDFL